MRGVCTAGALAVLLALPCHALAQDETEAEVPPPPPQVELRPPQVRFVSNVEGVEVLYLSDPILDDDGAGSVVIRAPEIGGYATLCAAPCQAELPQSHFGLAVRRGDETHRFPIPLGIDGPTGVALRADDHEDLRLAGTLTLAIGVPLGLALAAILVGADLATHDAIDVAGGVGLGVGGFVVSVSTALGLIFALQERTWSYQAVPLPTDAPEVFSPEF